MGKTMKINLLTFAVVAATAAYVGVLIRWQELGVAIAYVGLGACAVRIIRAIISMAID